MRAWEAMIETRHPRVIDFAIEHAESVRPPDHSLPLEKWLQAYLHLVGIDYRDGSLSRTCCDALYHIQFPESYFEDDPPLWRERIHPTWNLAEGEHNIQIGGGIENECLRCQGKLHRILLIDPVPAALEITGLSRLELAACLSCLGWEVQSFFYQHDDQGRPSHTAHDGVTSEPEFPVGPLKETTAGLAETPRRWFWQDWALSNSRENLNRIGGEPCWIQDAEYPTCPSCQRTMGFLLQLDSNLPTADGGEWMWGSGGIGYVFWCDHCKVSGWLWQCT